MELTKMSHRFKPLLAGFRYDGRLKRRAQAQASHQIPTYLLCVGMALVLLAAYSNHFHNQFHFDDFHTITTNPFIRDLRNVGRFFIDPSMFSTTADHATWRPVTSVSLAVDYWLGGNYDPFYFQLSTFCWYVVQVLLIFLLFRRLMDGADPHPWNRWAALLGAALYGLHPANAETVNYIIQRADVYAALGIVASLLWFVARPEQRRYGWYLLPAVAACLAKPTALIFPLIHLAYLRLFESKNGSALRKWTAALRGAAPAILIAAGLAILSSKMTPPSFQAGAQSAQLYRLTQPWIALHYFKVFFLPTDLSADTDWGYVSGAFSVEAIAGYLFIMLALAAAFRAARTESARPIAFGVLWFLITLLPTSLMPLAEVTNDHRMFLPFIGLTLAVVWTVRLYVYKRSERFAARRPWMRPAAALAVVVLVVAAAGTYQRNRVWSTEETLWRDVAEKSPRNGRGLMNYGLIFMSHGDYQSAYQYFQRALEFTPNYSVLEVNLGIASGGLQRHAEAERHFQRALALAPQAADSHFFYARWLRSVGRAADAIPHLETTLAINRHSEEARALLMLANTEAANADKAAILLELSHQLHLAGKFEECIAAAKAALQIRPAYAEAYNNIAAAYNSMQAWDDGIRAATEAVRLNPADQLARNNLLWAVAAKQKATQAR